MNEYRQAPLSSPLCSQLMRGIFILDSFANESLYALVNFGDELKHVSNIKV